jgi:hypothetical protein
MNKISIECIFIGVFFVIVGLSCLIIDLIFIWKGTCYEAEIKDIDDGDAMNANHFRVGFILNGREKEVSTLNFIYMLPFFEKAKLKFYRKKYVGKKVHVFYNARNELQTLIRELVWKRWLWDVFSLLAGIIIICMPFALG